MRISRLFAASCLLVLGGESNAFVVQPRIVGFQRHLNILSTSSLYATGREVLAGKEFQLEEREDRDSAITEIWLNEDGSVTLGETDGPLLKSFEGSWSVLETATETDRPFRLRLDRTYEADGTRPAVGEIDYHVKREFWGNIGKVGDAVEVEGIVHGLDESANIDCEVGFFALIDSENEGIKGEKK